MKTFTASQPTTIQPIDVVALESRIAAALAAHRELLEAAIRNHEDRTRKPAKETTNG